MGGLFKSPWPIKCDKTTAKQLTKHVSGLKYNNKTKFIEMDPTVEPDSGIMIEYWKFKYNETHETLMDLYASLRELAG